MARRCKAIDAVDRASGFKSIGMTARRFATMTRRATWFAPLFLVFGAAISLNALAQSAMMLPPDPVPLVIAGDGPDARFTVEIADEPEERSRGLMHRTDFATDRAMLFDFGEERLVGMWMKNTPLPLDMVFADEDGVITGIVAGTVPQSLDTISSPGPARYVLEINAGQGALLGIEAGERLVHPAIGQ
jgi:uncharacterized protein